MAAVSPTRVLVTRAAGGGSELADHLRALGAEPILIPAIEIVDPTSFATLDQALAQLDTFDWLLFTSANAVEAFARRQAVVAAAVPSPETVISSDAALLRSVISAGARSAERRDPCIPLGAPNTLTEPRLTHSSHGPAAAKRDDTPRQPAPKLAAIGPATARALRRFGLTPDLLPPQAVADSLTEALLPHTHWPDGTPTRFLLIRAEEAREHLPETLRAAGAAVTIAPAYRTVIPESSVLLLRELFVPAAARGNVGAITFTSSSTARNLLALCEAAGVSLPADALRISIGPITSATLRELGLPPHAEAVEATVASLAEAVAAALQRRPSPGA